jgi:hypothetical protein
VVHEIDEVDGVTFIVMELIHGDMLRGLMERQRLSVSRDAFTDLFRVEKLALINTMVGEYDRALDQIDYLLSIPSFSSVRKLQVDPRLDPLREHPRYREIIEKYQ